MKFSSYEGLKMNSSSSSMRSSNVLGRQFRAPLGRSLGPIL